MKTIAMPVYKLTSSCIWNSFQNSHKKHIIITGNRRIGKTTLLKNLFPASLPGITTWAEPGKAVYLKDNTTGQTVPVGIYDSALEGFENKMRLLGDGFSSLGITAIKNAFQSESSWISIDEIGYLESQCNDYLDILTLAMEKKHVLAVVRKQNLPHLEKLCKRNDVFLVDLDAPTGNMGCVIMASGLGTRFGENKLMADFNGKPLISYVLDATSEIFQKRVVVTRHMDIKLLCETMGIDVIFHSLPYQSDTIRLGLKEMSDTQHCIFCTADQPLLKHDTVISLALSAVNNPLKIFRPIYENTPGSPVIFPQWTYEELFHLPGDFGGSYVIKQHPESVEYLPVECPLELEDIDTPEDFVRLQKLAREMQ